MYLEYWNIQQLISTEPSACRVLTVPEGWQSEDMMCYVLEHNRVSAHCTERSLSARRSNVLRVLEHSTTDQHRVLTVLSTHHANVLRVLEHSTVQHRALTIPEGWQSEDMMCTERSPF